MRQSKFFLKTQKEPPRDEESKNAQLLLRAGFVDKLMAGSYTFLPLGLRVLKRIEKIIREELNATGAQEVLMPLLHPKSIWEGTGRWESAADIMFQLDKDGREFGLSFTHEEVVLDIAKKRNISYKDLPIKVYHFSNKFRNEKRPRSGLLRGIEFLMNDLYSLHESEEDFEDYYNKVKEAYLKIFARAGLEVKVVEAAGGVFTESFTHEFQLLAENGEDTIFFCEKCDWAQNKEIAKAKEGDDCPECGGKVKSARAIEVGNIFPLGTWYAEKTGATFVAKDGATKPFWFASYGIGTSRLIGAVAEVFSDKDGLIWPESIAPFKAHILKIGEGNEVSKQAEKVYEKLSEFDVLYDDREGVAAGEKFAEADLIGIPWRIVISEKTMEDGKIEIKKRGKKDAEKLSVEDIIKKLK